MGISYDPGSQSNSFGVLLAFAGRRFEDRRALLMSVGGTGERRRVRTRRRKALADVVDGTVSVDVHRPESRRRGRAAATSGHRFQHLKDRFEQRRSFRVPRPLFQQDFGRDVHAPLADARRQRQQQSFRLIAADQVERQGQQRIRQILQFPNYQSSFTYFRAVLEQFQSSFRAVLEQF